ncbi:MAG TPA: pantetheine-phosphate adenylyltransferase, partial [Flavobacteriales bacterium]|nr:pantetheine-phosphate adenylyltransferase [Flavobacteriales bacterium]
REAWLRQAFHGMPQVNILRFEGLTADLCERLGASFIVRGLRNSTDHGNERSIALMNHALRGVETLFLPALPEHAHISSTIVRELIANRADVRDFLPPGVTL